jgi:putative Mn2+ efflux pump MntP
MKKFINDILGQVWTLLGMFVAWVVLEGSAKTIVGFCIIGTLGLWAITYQLRNSNEGDE